MKWIGQHIWDFISRFRSDVYLEATETGTIASGGNLGLDSNNKIVKADTETGELSFDGNTVDGVLTYKDADEIKVSEELKLTGSSTATLQSTNGLFKLKGANVDGDDGKDLTIQGGNVLSNPTDKDGGNVSIIPGISTGENDDAKVSIWTSSPTSSGGTNQFQRENFVFYSPRRTQNGGVRNFKTFMIDQVLNGREATIEMREDTGDTYFRTWPNVYNTSGFPAGEIIFEPGKNGANMPIGDARFNSSGKFKFSNAAYSSNANFGFIETSSKEMTIGTVDSAGAAGHLNISPNGDTKITSTLYSENIFVGDNRKIYFTGDTDNVTKTSLYVVDPTSANSILLPDASGTVALTSQLDHDALTNFVANEHIDWTGASAGTIHATNYSNDNDDVSVANLKTRLAGGFASNAVSIGDSDDTVTIPGNLTVSGTTTTINTTDLNVEDKNITLNYHATNDTSGSADGAGITVQDAVNATTDASIAWNATDDTWDFSHKTVMPDLSRVDGRLFLGSASLSTAFRPNTVSSSKTIDLPNISGMAAILDPFAGSYSNGTLSPSAGVYTAVTNLSMGDVYNLNSTAVAITPTPHGSLTIMLTDCWVYVTTPNYTTSGIANTSNWAFQIGKTSNVGGYNKAKGFEGLKNRLAYNQAPNRVNVHRITHFPNASSNYGNPEPGLPLKVWTDIDPSGSASVGSESIMSIRLVTQYTIIPS